ncbi:MAG TPA: hypothetical protein ENI07_17230 [Desulfobacterales bacterium]|nr:hypothetical protein [Desulfobacterales bacterium]
MTLETGKQPTAQTININMGDVEEELCVTCKGKIFIEIVRCKKLSAIHSPTGKEEMVTFPAGLICASVNCRTVVGDPPLEV